LLGGNFGRSAVLRRAGWCDVGRLIERGILFAILAPCAATSSIDPPLP